MASSQSSSQSSSRARQTRSLRRFVQALGLALFFLLLFGFFPALSSILPADLYLQLDPLTGLSSALASRSWVHALTFGLVLLSLTLLFGRYFCGWICPLGALLDGFGATTDLWRALRSRMARRLAASLPAREASPAEKVAVAGTDSCTEDEASAPLPVLRGRDWKLLLLLLLLAAAPFGLQLAYLLDPLPLLARAFALLGIPQVARPVALPPPGIVPAGWTAVLLLAAIVLLSLIARRFWCRHLCPLGGLLALASRFSLFKLLSRSCTSCGSCPSSCPMGIRELGTVRQDSECIRCYSCAVACSRHEVGLGLHSGAVGSPLDLGRRAAVGSLAAGALLGASGRLVLARTPAERILPLRPPWAGEEPRFLGQCIRCGTCIRACPTGTLRALFFEEGALALWTPELVPTLGGCKADCTACGEACPTGAIASFTRETKFQVKVGLARFEVRACVAYGPFERHCSRCLPVCPTDAFVVHRCMHSGEAKPRGIIADRCVGCGLCEYVCVIETGGKPALVTTAQGRGERTRL